MMQTYLFSDRIITCWLAIFICIFWDQIQISKTASVVDSGHHTSSDHSYANSDHRLVSILQTFYPSLNESYIALISASNSSVIILSYFVIFLK